MGLMKYSLITQMFSTIILITKKKYEHSIITEIGGESKNFIIDSCLGY